MKINPILISIFISSAAFSNSSFSQEFVLKCSKYYSGSKKNDVFNILISSDKSNGFIVNNEENAYRLKLLSSGDTYYEYSAIPYISAKNSFNWFSYKSISINRQNLQLTTTVRNEESSRTVLDCQKDSSDVRKLVEKVEIQANVNRQNQQRDEILKKEKLLKEAQF